MASLLFVLRRARRHWQLLLTLSLGVILATGLMASGPLLAETVVEMGLHLTFQSSDVPESNLRLVTTAAVDQIDSAALDGEVRDLLGAALGKHLDRTIRSAQSPWVFPWLDGEPAADQRLNLRAYEGIKDHLEYVAGEWPAESAMESGAEADAEPVVVPVVVGEAMARALVLRVGQRLPLSLRPGGAEPDAWLEVAGIARPRDPLEAYWFGRYSPLTSPSTPFWLAEYGAIVPEDLFWPTVAALFPGDEVDLAWHVLLRHDAFSAADIEPFQAQLAALDAGLDSLRPGVTLETGVPDILARFQAQLESIRVPLYILIAEVMLLALYFVTMVAALSMRQVEREFAILRSRGTSAWQVARIQLIEALAIGAAAFISGPWLGAALVRTLAWIGPLADLEQVNWRLAPGPGAWLAAGVGTLACLACLLLPLRPALRRSIITHQQMVARSSRPPWWQRLYLDVFALVGGLILLWRLRLYGQMVGGGPGGVQLDWLLLLAPVVLLLGTATILLRLFPLLLRAVAALAARGSGLEQVLALWQASRDPAHVTRLVLLLALAVALGNLSLGLNITLDQSEYDRATYLAGNDLRLVSEGAVPLVDLQTAPGVVRLSATWRGTGSVDLGEGEENPVFEILAIEPDSFASVTTSRRDFAGQKIDELLARLAVAEGENPSLLPLPGQPARFGLWLWGLSRDKAELDSYSRWLDGNDDAERVGVVAKLQTAQGELFTAPLLRPETSGAAALQIDSLTVKMKVAPRDVGLRDMGLRLRIRPDNQGWHYFEGSLPVLPPSSYPLSLHSLWFENQATRLGEPIPMGITLVADDLLV
ncbi:MAG: FtsX-like permease family protein, partial [Anaerolineae bacterium]